MSDLFHWPGPDLRRTVLAGLAYFIVVFATGFLLGTLRVFLLNPWLGKTAAVSIELPVILTVAWIACRRLIAAFDVPSQLALRLVMGGLAFLTLMCAELGLSVFAFGLSAITLISIARYTHFWGLPAKWLSAFFLRCNSEEHIGRRGHERRLIFFY